jgi:hypothetical protein
MNIHVARALSAFGVAGVLAGAAWTGIALGQADDVVITFDQRAFPCQEDEMLGYSPAFGPDLVGCIHVDDMRVAHGVAAADDAVPGPVR